MALPTLNYSERLPQMQTSIPGVWAVNSAHILKGNLNVNETIQIAEEAIDTVLAPTIESSKRTCTSQVEPASQPTIESHDEADRELVARS
jgi:hypothetical protein